MNRTPAAPRDPRPSGRARPASSTPAPDQPRYAQIATQLREAIARGEYPVGAQLPTELELCERLKVSRFTIREAIRVLANAGLVRRKPRAGTVVTALPDETRYAQGITSVRDLFQYAQSTDFQYVYIGRQRLSKEEARRMGATVGEEWIYAVAIRRDKPGGRAFGITRLYLNPALEGIEAMLRNSHEPVYSMIERGYNVRIERIEQSIAGVVIDAQDAANLGVPAGSAGLLITRSYYDRGGRLLEMADNTHPAERFTYHMVLKR